MTGLHISGGGGDGLTTAQAQQLTDTLAETKEIERHLHNYERWYGPAAVASGEDHVADPLGEAGGSPSGVLTSFTLTSGTNSDWGTAVQVWGATDCSLLPAGRQAVFDLHRIRFTDVDEDKEEWLLAVIAGDSAAAGIAADTYSIVPFFIEKTDKEATPLDLYSEREVAGTKIWMMLLHVTDAAAESVTLQHGAHGYPE